MNRRSRLRSRHHLLALAIGSFAGSALAHTQPLGSDGQLRYNFTATYGLAQRLEAPNAALTSPTVNPGNANANDGNLNFSKNAIINNRLSLLGEVDARYSANQGVFLRAQAFYDAAYHGKTDNRSPAALSSDNHAPGQSAFPQGTRRASGGEAEFLDAYWYGDFKTGETSALNVKVGRHVVQWGEGVFFANIAGAQSPVDVNKVNVPGAQVKDFLLPVGQVSASYILNDKTTLMAYWQYEHRPIKIPAVGSFWSGTDLLGPGGERMWLLPPSPGNPAGVSAPRRADIKARNSGQWGIGGRYVTDAGTELGLYHLRYHSRAPSVQTNLVGIPVAPFVTLGSYQAKYQEDIKLTGMSFNTRVGDAAVAGEVSYKQNVPIWVLNNGSPTNLLPSAGNLAYNPLNGVARGNVWQAQASSVYILSPNALASGGITLMGELAWQHAGSKKTPLARVSSRDVAAVSLLAMPSYPSIANGWDLSLPMSYMQILGGKTNPTCNTTCHSTFPNGDSLSLAGDKEKRLSLGAQLTYMANLKIGATYTRFLGRPDYVHNPLGDRDNLALSVSYNF